MRRWNPFVADRNCHGLVVDWLWMPSADFCASSAHFFSGALIAHVLGLHWGMWAAWGILLGWALPKEFWWDQYMEPDPVVWNGLIDLAGYAVGGAFGTALLFWN